MTRSPAQKPACKDLGRNGQSPTITPKATYTPVSNRADSRSQKIGDCNHDNALSCPSRANRI
ncbi:alpha-galactosidase [Lacticaseibacillus zeae]|uniref:Alpha-galactosidase n=1 Tax=Lacticaseibacillus zeae TaxID=57037 RepID=A0A5R8LUR8_LACZE|nr:alpha-galactosidase [Lacticaseibacillus zeae]